MACKERGRERKRGEINRAGTGKERWRDGGKGKTYKGNDGERKETKQGETVGGRVIGRTKGSKKGRGGGVGGVRDRRRERENVRGLKRREGGKRWKVEQWGKLLLIFCL